MTTTQKIMKMEGRRMIGVSNNPELTAKLGAEQGKILEFLLRGVREFHKQHSGPDIDTQHISVECQ